MKAKRLLTISLALSVILTPTFASAASINLDGATKTVNGIEVEILPKAKKKHKNKDKEEAVVERSTTVEILDEKGKNVGIKKFKATTQNDELQSQSKASLAATRTVTVLAVADEEYRAAYGDWQSRIQNIVEQADDAFNRDHAIDFQVQAIANWSSQGGNASQILSDLSRDWSGYNYDFVVGFTRESDFNAGGIAYRYSYEPRGSAFSVNLDQGTYNTWHAAQHEFSHNFGLPHDAQGSGIRCIMNYDYSYQVDYWDADHDAQIERNEYWY